MDSMWCLFGLLCDVVWFAIFILCRYIGITEMKEFLEQV
jgi:hypothetical protein